MTRPVNHVIDADIKGFFDNVSHEWLMKFLQVRISDPSFLLLIGSFLKAGYIDARQFVETERGTPQGGNLSPILSNVFLHYVLDLWFERRVKARTPGRCHLVRYADDVLCLVQYKEDAECIRWELQERLAKFDLELHPGKTVVISFGRYERENAKRQKRKPHTFDFLGFTHFCGQSRRGKFIVGRKTSAKKFRQKCKALNAWLKAIRNTVKTKDWWLTLMAKLRGHYQYYGVSGNMPSLLRTDTAYPLLHHDPAARPQVAEPAEPAQAVQLGALQRIPGALPAADAPYRAPPVHAVAGWVSLAEEPDAGNPHVRFCEGH